MAAANADAESAPQHAEVASRADVSDYPDVGSYVPRRENAAPMSPVQVIHTSDNLRRAAIAGTSDVDVLRKIIQTELRNEHPRGEVVAMCNQQIAKLREVGLA